MGDCYYIWLGHRAAAHPVPQVRKILNGHAFAIVVAIGTRGAPLRSRPRFELVSVENKSATMNAHIYKQLAPGAEDIKHAAL